MQYFSANAGYRQKLKLILGFVFFLLGLQPQAQDKLARKYARAIKTENLYTHLEVLSSDSLQGRGSGTIGSKKTAVYIHKFFEQLGLRKPMGSSSHFQPYNLYKSQWSTIYLKKGDDEKIGQQEFLYYSEDETKGEEMLSVVWMGDDLDRDVSLDGKYVAFEKKEWGEWNTDIQKLKSRNPAGFIVTTWNANRLEQAMGFYNRFLDRPTLATELPAAGDKVLVMDTTALGWIFETDYGALRPGQTGRVILNADRLIETLDEQNVLGMIPGSDKQDEIIVITAHHDHLGINESGEIHPGADDNGTGTSAILELAKTFKEAADKGHGPRRSMLFMTFSGEENGLLGSKYYVKNPVYPLERIVCNLNIDMIGRNDEHHTKDDTYIYLIGSDKLSQDLHNVSEMANSSYANLTLDYTFNDDKDPNRFYYRSDHYNFAKNGIPVIFYFSGVHEDYHKPTDTLEKINMSLYQKRVELIFYTAWEIANRDERLQLD